MLVYFYRESDGKVLISLPTISTICENIDNKFAMGFL